MITIVLPISRSDYLRPVFECLNNLERPDDTELLIIIDGNSSLERAVDRRLNSINYKQIRLIKYGEIPAEDINKRRYRISKIHNKIKHYINDDCQYLFLVEDDTTYPADALSKLMEVFDFNIDCRYAEGVELGRRKTPYIGAWDVDDVNDPCKIVSCLPSRDGRWESISAGGFYCALVDAKEYRTHHFEPLDNTGTNGLSCDINFGLYLKRKGYKCYIDWSIQCDHIGELGSVNLGNTAPVQVVFEKYNNKWFSYAK